MLVRSSAWWNRGPGSVHGRCHHWLCSNYLYFSGHGPMSLCKCRTKQNFCWVYSCHNVSSDLISCCHQCPIGASCVKKEHLLNLAQTFIWWEILSHWQREEIHQYQTYVTSCTQKKSEMKEGPFQLYRRALLYCAANYKLDESFTYVIATVVKTSYILTVEFPAVLPENCLFIIWHCPVCWNFLL